MLTHVNQIMQKIKEHLHTRSEKLFVKNYIETKSYNRQLIDDEDVKTSR